MSGISTDPIDRLSPGRRPGSRVVMYQKWRFLSFLHWSVPPDSLRALLPAGLELDLYDGRAYVGLVPFTMLEVRPAGFPSVPWLSSFHETNVRTYVHFKGQDPGVWFFSLEAANPVAVAMARAMFHLPYHHARMTLDVEPSLGGSVSYSSDRLWPGPLPARCSVSCMPRPTVAPAEPGTLDHFLIERYFLYCTSRGRIYRGQVHHDPYPVQTADISGLEETLLASSGLTRSAEVPLAHYAPGVDVEIFSLRRVANS